MLERDKRVIELINDLGICTRQQIQNVIFTDVHENVCLRRLAMLSKREQIKREYFNLGNNKNVYVYYSNNKPNKDTIQSDLIITDYLIQIIKENTEILEIERNTIKEDSTSNTVIKYKSKDKIKYAFLKLQSEEHDLIKNYNQIKSKEQREIPKLIYIIDKDLNVVKKLKFK